MAIDLALFATIVAAAVAFVLWSRTRRRHVHFDLPRDVDRETFIRALAAYTWSHVVHGNSVRIVQNAHFFDEFIRDVGKATHHVHLETFLWMDGSVSDMVVAALTAASRRGIEVRVLVDHRGAKTTSSSVWRALREAGVDFRVFHRARLHELGWYNNRDHRKIVVIDGHIGYTFGHGMADMWGAGPGGAGWRDTAARVEGPIVADLQMTFFENWAKVTRRAPVGIAYFPEPQPCGDIPMHVAWASPTETTSAVQRLYDLAIASAKHEIILQNPYFLPGRHSMRLYREAAKRGVTVRLMFPTSGTSDFPIVQHASHFHYGSLLQAGAIIYEYTRSGIHQKVMIIDREWCTIGSTNFDPRSFRINDEISLAIHDPGVAQSLAEAFEHDIAGATIWTLERWQRRTLRHRAYDRLSTVMKRQL